jgi:hypothetical protein
MKIVLLLQKVSYEIKRKNERTTPGYNTNI